MLRYKTKIDLVQSPYMTSGHETERVYSYNSTARKGPFIRFIPFNHPTQTLLSDRHRCGLWPSAATREVQ